MGNVIVTWEPAQDIDAQILELDGPAGITQATLLPDQDFFVLFNIQDSARVVASISSVKNGQKSDPLGVDTIYVPPTKINFRYVFDYLSKEEAIEIVKQYVGLSKPIDTNDVPNSLKPHGILCWLEFKKYITKFAYVAYKQMETAYLNNRFNFIWNSNISRQTKLDILGGNIKINKSTIKPNNYVYCWTGTNVSLSNLLISPLVFWSQPLTLNRNIKPTHTQLKTALNQMPVGHKSVRLDNVVTAFYQIASQFYPFYFDGTPLGQYERIWMDAWKANVTQVIDTYFAQCKNQNIDIDYVMVDLEEQKNVFYFRQEKNPAGENLPHIDVQKDSRWPDFRNKFEIDEIDTMMTWDAGSNPKSHRWNAAVYNLLESYTEEIYNTIKKHYPNIRFSSYNGWEYCGGLYPLGDTAGDKTSPIGAGYAPGTESTINLYATSGRIWWSYSRSTLDFPPSPWAGLFTDAFKIYATIAASKKNQSFWIQPPSVGNRIQQYARCQIMMFMFMSDQILYWNGKNSNSTIQDDTLISDVAKELDAELAQFNNKGTPIIGQIHTSLPTSTIEMSKDFGTMVKTLRIFKDTATYSFINETHEQFYRRNQ